MKRVGNLFESIVSFENLLAASRRARLGKRHKTEVMEFEFDLERNLHVIEAELRSGSWRSGEYRNFTIYEPKRRIISAAPYRDRVVHHALCAVIEPVFEASMSPSAYANRRGMGTHKALARCKALTRRYPWVLRADFEKYFPSIDHAILKEKFRRRIKCERTLELMDRIVDGSPEVEPAIRHFSGDDLLTPLERRRGLPIGNLTSQIWANVYLTDLDHDLAKTFGGRRYLRYVDDLALFGDDPEELRRARGRLEGIAEGHRLRTHPVKTFVAPTRVGTNWLGFRVLPDRTRVRAENLKRARRRLRGMQEDFRVGRLSGEEVRQRVRCWIAHLEHGDTWRLRERIFAGLVFSGAAGRGRTARALRGGNWNNNPRNCRPANRNNNTASNRNNNNGFRLA